MHTWLHTISSFSSVIVAYCCWPCLRVLEVYRVHAEDTRIWGFQITGLNITIHCTWSKLVSCIIVLTQWIFLHFNTHVLFSGVVLSAQRKKTHQNHNQKTNPGRLLGCKRVYPSEVTENFVHKLLSLLSIWKKVNESCPNLCHFVAFVEKKFNSLLRLPSLKTSCKPPIPCKVVHYYCAWFINIGTSGTLSVIPTSRLRTTFKPQRRLLSYAWLGITWIPPTILNLKCWRAMHLPTTSGYQAARFPALQREV